MYIFDNIEFNDWNTLIEYKGKKMFQFGEELKNGIDNKEERLKLKEEFDTLYQERQYNFERNFWLNFDEDLKEYKYKIHIPKGDNYKLCVEALIRCGAIPMNELKVDHFYDGQWRGGHLGQWKGDHFHMYRWEWTGGKNYYWGHQKVNHFEKDDGFALMIPLREISEKEFNEMI